MCIRDRCNSVRPAFVLEAHRANVVVKLMYVYIPMGLERELGKQGSVLARFGSHELASCFLAVASENYELVTWATHACVPFQIRLGNTAPPRRFSSGGMNCSHRVIFFLAIEFPWTNILFLVRQTGVDVQKTVTGVAEREHREALRYIGNIMRTSVI